MFSASASYHRRLRQRDVLCFMRPSSSLRQRALQLRDLLSSQADEQQVVPRAQSRPVFPHRFCSPSPQLPPVSTIPPPPPSPPLHPLLCRTPPIVSWALASDLAVTRASTTTTASSLKGDTSIMLNQSLLLGSIFVAGWWNESILHGFAAFQIRLLRD
jgi:hypothetical protein